MAELNVIDPVNKRVWKAFGIWDEPKQRRTVASAKAA